MNYFSKLYTRWQHFLHNETLKQKVYSIVFESDTPKGRLFDIILISSIIVSVLMVILESMHLFSPTAYWVLRLLEYLLTLFFTIEYLARIYCLKNPRKYIFSFFGLVDLLATLPVYLSFFLKGAHYLLVIRASGSSGYSASSSCSPSSAKVICCCAPCVSVHRKYPYSSFSSSSWSLPWEQSCT